MNFKNTSRGFVPYKSYNSMYENRTLPEFGEVVSEYVVPLNSWKFQFYRNESHVPSDFELPIFDDSTWDVVETPSSWQTTGYSLPRNLLHDYPLYLKSLRINDDMSATDRYFLKSTNFESDEVGIYRTNVIFESEDIDRAIYLDIAGISGYFEIYFNGMNVLQSHSVYTNKRVLLSNNAHEGVNTIVILVYQFDRDSNGKIIAKSANFGFSGIIRPISIVYEPLLEIDNLMIETSLSTNAYNNSDNLALATKELSVEGVSCSNFSMKIKYSITNHTSYNVKYKVDYHVVEVKNEYDPYNMPELELQLDYATTGAVNPNMVADVAVDLEVFDAMRWSDATPFLYDFIIELKNDNNEVICAKRKRIGFRTTEMVADNLTINDKKINLNLVKYYEFDSQSGISVTIDRMRQDIMLMKCAGINAIICQNIPINEVMLNLCDQYGLMVIASTHKYYFEDQIMSLMHHPSIIAWGITDFCSFNEKYIGIKEKLKMLDSTRPWYFGNDADMKVTDIKPFPSIVGNVYGYWIDLCLDRKYINSINKTGKNIFMSIPGRPVCDDDDADYKWIHHVDLVGTKNRLDSAIGQGIINSNREIHPIYIDIKKQCEPVEMYFSPEEPDILTIRNKDLFAFTEDYILEWKLLLGGNAINDGGGRVNSIEPLGVRSVKFPIDIDSFTKSSWAGNDEKLFERYDESLSHELILDISLKLAKSTYYATGGFEVAFYQHKLLDDVCKPEMIELDKLESGLKDAKLIGSSEDEEVENIENTESDKGNEGDDKSKKNTLGFLEEKESKDKTVDLVKEMVKEDVPKLTCYATVKKICVGNDDFEVSFDKTSGSLTQIRIKGVEFISSAGGMIPSFYRCPTNIDRTDKSFILSKTIFSKETDYETIQKSLQFKGCSYGVRNNVFEYKATYKSFAMKKELLVFYKIYGDGRMKATLTFTPKYDMVRYGFRVPIKQEGLICRWYGLGPGETYFDRKMSGRIGVFTAGADKIFHSYARPAENSNHTDTRVVQIMNPGMVGFEIKRNQGKEKFDFTVLPYSPEQMNDHLHEEQLIQNEYSELFIDFCTREIERTNKNLTQQPLKKGNLYNETFEFRFDI